MPGTAEAGGSGLFQSPPCPQQAGGRAGGLGAAAHIFPVTSFILLPLIPCLSHWERSRGGSCGQGKGLSLGHLQERPAPLTHLPYLGPWTEYAQGQPSQHQSYRERPALRTPDMELRGHILHQAENGPSLGLASSVCELKVVLNDL